MTDKAGDDVVQGVMNVSKEDQDKINRFAKLNARLEDVKDDMIAQTNELKNCEDALSEAEMKILEDEGDKLFLQLGSIMVSLPPEQSQKWLEEKMDGFKSRVKELEKQKETIVEEMGQLKAHLYARFGSNIHLESGP